MLVKTMGSPLAFEYRREELGLIGARNGDDDVAASYLGKSDRTLFMLFSFCIFFMLAIELLLSIEVYLSAWM